MDLGPVRKHSTFSLSSWHTQTHQDGDDNRYIPPVKSISTSSFSSSLLTTCVSICRLYWVRICFPLSYGTLFYAKPDIMWCSNCKGPPGDPDRNLKICPVQIVEVYRRWRPKRLIGLLSKQSTHENCREASKSKVYPPSRCLVWLPVMTSP
jgi:hypothetical protein